jgi:hypothetical protein
LWIRNTSFLLFSDHGGPVKSTVQELLNAGVPRKNIFCAGVIYYDGMLQLGDTLDGNICTIPPWNTAIVAFLSRNFPRRKVDYTQTSGMHWTLLESPDDIRNFERLFCPHLAAFDIAWVDIPCLLAVLVASCIRKEFGIEDENSGSLRHGLRLVIRMGHRSKAYVERQWSNFHVFEHISDIYKETYIHIFDRLFAVHLMNLEETLGAAKSLGLHQRHFAGHCAKAPPL